jgi:hypothetical protein
VAGLYLVLTVIAVLTAHDGGGIGLAFIGLGFLIIGIIPVAIVVVLCILLFLFKSHPRTTPKNGSYTFHVDYVFVVVTIMAIIAIAWWIISHVF